MALQDKIGREVLVDKICGLVDSLKKDSNFCLAINGAWGSGKSFVLGLIEERLSKKEKYILIFTLLCRICYVIVINKCYKLN